MIKSTFEEEEEEYIYLQGGVNPKVEMPPIFQMYIQNIN
jgi:hypothetical protein